MKLHMTCLLVAIVTGAALAQTCPKVAYSSNQATTIRSLVSSVNCLVAEKAPKAVESTATGGMQVDVVPIIGPQHTRAYRKIVLAILSVLTGNTTKAVLVMPDSSEASVSATAGAECHAKINRDNTADAQCNQTGGTLYVVYRN